MKKIVFGLILLTSLSMTQACCKQEEQSVDKSAIVLDNIAQRKSVRSFTNESVTKDQLEKIVRAGMAAPSAINKQPWAFVVLTDKSIMNALAEKLPNAKMLSQAAAAIVVCGDMNKAIEGDARDFWIQDTSAATENILLAVEAMGLGAVWTGAYPNKEKVDIIRDMLKLPDDIIPLNVIPIGHPTGDNQPKNKWIPENVHWDKW